jgi:RNA polymerase sigma factor (sigma-70 family)
LDGLVNPTVGSFEAFYEQNFGSVYRSLWIAFREPGLAEEAAQEAFARAFSHWRRVAQMERPVGWVYVVAVRYGIRRAAPAPAIDRPSPGDDPIERIATGETLRDALEKLPTRQRLAVTLRYYADLPLADVAAAMGCAVGTAKSTLHAALGHLRVDLDDSREGTPDNAR